MARRSQRFCGRHSLPVFLYCIAVVMLAGCSSGHYRKSADKEAYGIIQQVEQQVFRRTNQFTIDTAYSGRKPADILPTELIEDRLQTNRRVLTLEAALELSIKNSRRFQSEKENLYLKAIELSGARYAFGPQFSGTAAGNLDRASNGERAASGQARVGVSQLLKSGGRLSVTLANNLLRYYTGSPRRSVVSLISVELAQPLLRGFGKNSQMVESLTQAERNMVYAVRNYAYFQDDFALEIVSDYFRLLQQKDTLRNRYTNYLNLVQSTRRLEARAADREAVSGVNQARQAELTAKNAYVNTIAAYSTALDQFKIKLGLALGERVYLDDDELTRLQQTGLVPAQLTSESAYRFAVERHWKILNAIDSFEDAKRRVKVEADKLKPGLNLVADASLESDRPTDYTKFDPDNVRAGMGIELDLPLDRLTQRNSYRRALVTFESELRNLTLTLDTLRDSIERGLRTVEQLSQNYEIERNSLTLANVRVASTTLLLQAGRSEVRDLLEAQAAQISAQNAVTRALVDHQDARLQLMLDIGALSAEPERFWLKDHVPALLASGPAAAPARGTGEGQLLTPDEFLNQ